MCMFVRSCCPLTWNESERSWQRTSMSSGSWTRSSWVGHTEWWVYLFLIIWKSNNIICIEHYNLCVYLNYLQLWGFCCLKLKLLTCDTAELMIQTDAVFQHDCYMPCNSFSQREDSCEIGNSTAHTSNLLAWLWRAVKSSHKMSKQKGGQHGIPSSALCSRYCKYLTELELSGSCKFVWHQWVLLPLTLLFC